MHKRPLPHLRDIDSKPSLCVSLNRRKASIGQRASEIPKTYPERGRGAKMFPKVEVLTMDRSGKTAWA